MGKISDFLPYNKLTKMFLVTAHFSPWRLTKWPTSREIGFCLFLQYLGGKNGSYHWKINMLQEMEPFEKDILSSNPLIFRGYVRFCVGVVTSEEVQL